LKWHEKPFFLNMLMFFMAKMVKGRFLA